MDQFIVGSRMSRDWVLRSEPGCLLMHPSPPKWEEELADHVETWQGEDFKLAPLYKISALRMLMQGPGVLRPLGSGPRPDERGEDVRGAAEQGQGLCQET